MSPVSPEQSEVISDDDTMTRAESVWNSDVVYPSYDQYPPGSDEEDEGGLSPYGGPMVPGPLYHGKSSTGSSPGKSTWKAGLGADGFRFSIDTWRPGPPPIPDPQPQTTPSRRAMDASIDSVSLDEPFETPIGSRASTKSGRTPSMGNKLELDARRSERNMRYNALYQEQAQQQQEKKSSSPVRMHARFVFGGSSGDLDPNEAQYFPDYSSAYAGSQEGTPEKTLQHQNRISSEDSITVSLRSASDNMEKLRALLGEIDSDGEKNPPEEDIVDAFTTASSPRSKLPVGRKARALRSDSPSPEPNASFPLPATPVIGPIRSSPTTSHADQSSNGFTVLDIEVDIVSSPASDDTATADLPTTVTQHNIQEHRVGSGDTLDQALHVLSSLDSGYKADESSEIHLTPDAGPGKQIPRRYRSQSNRNKGRKALAEISGNRG